ncbi:Protein of unknown function, partial [Gryllus bimaculatus]
MKNMEDILGDILSPSSGAPLCHQRTVTKGLRHSPTHRSRTVRLRFTCLPAPVFWKAKSLELALSGSSSVFPMEVVHVPLQALYSWGFVNHCLKTPSLKLFTTQSEKSVIKYR